MKGVTNNPNGRPRGSLNKNRKHLKEMAEKHDVDLIELAVLIAKGDLEGLGYDQPYDQDGNKVPTPLDLRWDAIKFLIPFEIAKKRSDETDDDTEKKIERLAYALPKEGELK